MNLVYIGLIVLALGVFTNIFELIAAVLIAWAEALSQRRK